MTPKKPTNLAAARLGVLDVAVLTAVMVFATSQEAWAYIDPGTGSYLFQLLIAGGLAGAYTVRRYWHTLKATLARFGRTGSRSSPTRSNGVE
jgi:hypothetical protein